MNGSIPFPYTIKNALVIFEYCLLRELVHIGIQYGRPKETMLITNGLKHYNLDNAITMKYGCSCAFILH